MYGILQKSTTTRSCLLHIRYNLASEMGPQVFPHSPHPSTRGYLVNLANVRPAFFLSGSSRDPLYNVIRISCKHACRANVLQPLVLGLLFETRIKYYDIYITNIHWRCGPWRMQRRETVYIKRSTFITFCLQFTL